MGSDQATKGESVKSERSRPKKLKKEKKEKTRDVDAVSGDSTHGTPSHSKKMKKKVKKNESEGRTNVDDPPASDDSADGKKRRSKNSNKDDPPASDNLANGLGDSNILVVQARVVATLPAAEVQSPAGVQCTERGLTPAEVLPNENANTPVIPSKDEEAEELHSVKTIVEDLSGSDTMKMYLIMLATTLLPSVVALVLYSVVGIGEQIYSDVARHNTNTIGNVLLVVFAAWVSFLYVVDGQRGSRIVDVSLIFLSVAILVVSATLKGFKYPWAAPFMLALFAPITVFRLRTTCYPRVIHRKYWLPAALMFAVTAFITGISWCVWSASEDAFGSKARDIIIEDTEELYKRARDGDDDLELVTAAGCKLFKENGGERPSEIVDADAIKAWEKNLDKFDKACTTAERVWTTCWLVPLWLSVFTGILGIFSFIQSRYGRHGENRGAQVIRLIKVNLCVMVFGLGLLYVGHYVLGASNQGSTMFMAMSLTLVVGIMIWTILEVRPEVLKQATNENKMLQRLVGVFQSDWVRAVGFGMLGFFIPIIYVLDLVRERIRRLTGRSAASGCCLTQEGQRFVHGISGWNFNSILSKVCLFGELFMMLNLGSKCTFILFSALNVALEDLELFLICVITFFTGIVMFLLPPVPGTAVYIFAGVVIGKKAQADGTGFWAGVVLASVVAMVAKLAGCVGQWGIGFVLGKSIFIQKLIGVDKVPTRAIEKILKIPGMGIGKVGILVGGPDWPTSVTCGILRLYIPQMLLGTLPVYIASVAPQALVGALLTKESMGKDKALWQNISLGANSLAAVAQAGTMLIAMWKITTTAENCYDELAAYRPEHEAVAQLTEKEAALNTKLAEVSAWPRLNASNKARIVLATTLVLISCAIVALDMAMVEPLSFRKFKVINKIGDPYDKDGLDGSVFNIIRQPVGTCALGIFFVATIIHIVHGMCLSSTAKAELKKDPTQQVKEQTTE